MKLKVNKQNLVKSLQKVSGIITTRSTLPVLANVLLEAKDNILTITSTDLELRISSTLKVEVEREGVTTLPVNKLLSTVTLLLKSKDDDDIILDCDLDKHYTDIECGVYKGTIVGLPSDDFPRSIDINPIRVFKLKEAEFAKIIEKISYAVSLDDSRQVLHGILLSVKENTFTTVATDGKRLALIEKIIDDYNGNDGDSILPLKSANELKKIMNKENNGDVLIEFSENQAIFKTNNVTLTTKLIEGNYPNYRQVIPNSFSKEISLPTLNFRSCIELVSLSITDDKGFIEVTFDNNKILFNVPGATCSKDEMNIEYEDETLQVSFNPDYILDPFKHTDTDVMKMKVNDQLSPIGLEDGNGFLYIIMPIRNKNKK